MPSPSQIPSYSNTQTINTLQSMAGRNWLINDYDGQGIPYMRLSPDNGVTWNDITPGLGGSCSLDIGDAVSSHYVFARCNGGSVVWVYGPVN